MSLSQAQQTAQTGIFGGAWNAPGTVWGQRVSGDERRQDETASNAIEDDNADDSPASQQSRLVSAPIPKNTPVPSRRPEARPESSAGSGAETANPATTRAANAHPIDDADRNLDFDALVRKYEKKIFNVIYRFIGDYEEATDLTQETFLSAFRHYDRFRGDAKVFTWLYQIARNLCINRIRQRDRQRALRIESLDQPRDADDDEGLTRDVPDYTHAPQTVMEEKELRERIMAAVESLPPDYKEVVLLREFHNMSYNEIVEATGLTLENVKTRLSRARGMLRRKLEPYYRM